jgi:chemotaxis protein histidine kinase CheA
MMSLRVSLFGSIGALVLALAAPREGLAAPEDAVVRQMETMNGAAIASYAIGNHKKARSQLMDALALAKRKHLDGHPIVARTNVNLGIVYLRGLQDRQKAIWCFVTALRMRPSIEVTPALATADVLLDFEEARSELPSPPASGPAAEKIARAKKERDRKRKECEAEASEKFEVEKDNLMADLSVAKDTVSKERQARDRLQKQKMDAERELGQVRDSERKEREAKEKLQREKALADKQLAQVTDSERKEREAKEKLQREKSETEQKLAQARDSERKERDARAAADRRASEAGEMLQKEKQLAAAGEKDRLDRQQRETKAQEKLAQARSDVGPSLFCAAPEKNGKAGLVIQCMAQGAVRSKAHAATLYYRAAGAKHYTKLPMKRTKNGGFAAAILTSHVGGPSLQYYVQASDARGGAVAMNGKPALPNAVTLAGGATSATTATGTNEPSPADRRTLATTADRDRMQP